MGTTTIEYRLLPGTRASVGRAGTHSVIADRPEGKAGGMGLGFNGGELLALAIGGCFCNDMQALADEAGVEIADLAIAVSIDFGGTPSRAIGARMDGGLQARRRLRSQRIDRARKTADDDRQFGSRRLSGEISGQ